MRYACPSAIFDYLGGQMGDKTGENLQIWSQAIMLEKSLLEAYTVSMLFFAKNHFPRRIYFPMRKQTSLIISYLAVKR